MRSFFFFPLLFCVLQPAPKTQTVTTPGSSVTSGDSVTIYLVYQLRKNKQFYVFAPEQKLLYKSRIGTKKSWHGYYAFDSLKVAVDSNVIRNKEFRLEFVQRNYGVFNKTIPIYPVIQYLPEYRYILLNDQLNKNTFQFVAEYREDPIKEMFFR